MKSHLLPLIAGGYLTIAACSHAKNSTTGPVSYSDSLPAPYATKSSMNFSEDDRILLWLVEILNEKDMWFH